MNDVLTRLGVIDMPQAYLSTRGLALLLVIIFEAWRYFPFAMLMIRARLQAIDDALYEAAEVDGANNWQKFQHIAIPELRYVLGATFLLRLLWTFNKFDDIFLLTGGGFGTKVLPILTYEFSFKTFNFGKGAAAAMLQLVLVLAFLAYSYSHTQLFGNYMKNPHLFLILIAAVAGLVAARLYLGAGQLWKAWAGSAVFIACVALFGVVGLFPAILISTLNPAWSLTIHNSASSPLTLKIMLGVALVFVPIVIAYQAWSLKTFSEPIKSEADMEY